MAHTARTSLLVERVRADLKLVTDQQTRDLVSAWANAWNEVAPDLNTVLVNMLVAGEHVTRAELMRSERLSKVLVVIADHLEQLAADSRVRILGDLRRVIDIAGGAQASIIDSQLPAGAQHLVDLAEWTRVDARSIEAIVKRSTQQITSKMRPLSREAQRAVRAELVRGYAAGQNPRRTAGRIVGRAEGRFNGGLTRALTIARTETLDASRAGGHIGRILNADVLDGWEWHCEFGARTCPACIAKDGTVHPLDELGPNDHPNGRCTAIPKAKSWAELGIDLPEPAPLRQTGQQWFEAQPASVQRQILGPSRYDAWKAGDYPPEKWAVMTHNPGWRPSLQVSKPPAAYRGGRSAGSALAS